MSGRPKPKSVFRRIERWIVGLVLGAIAFGLEKAVMRSIKKGRTTPTREEPGEPFATSRGTEVSG